MKIPEFEFSPEDIRQAIRDALSPPDSPILDGDDLSSSGIAPEPSLVQPESAVTRPSSPGVVTALPGADHARATVPAAKAADVRYGATPEEWRAFSSLCGPDLLPCVASITAKVSPNSKLKQLGKVPSIYNRRREAVGIPDWPQHIATEADITKWAREPDYSICVITRRKRALDVDVSDSALAAEIRETITRVLGKLPTRTRSNSAKFLMMLDLPGDFAKRTITTSGGVIEWLANGQQFLAAGTHVSGVRYEWGGTPIEVPTVSAEKFEELWATLAAEFGIEPPTEAGKSDRHTKLAEAAVNDSIAIRLRELGLVLAQDRSGRIDIRCPFESEHTTGESESATSYFPAHTGGFSQGAFKCHHGHCAKRTQAEFLAAIGITAADDFEDISGEKQTEKGKRFEAIPIHEFAQGASPAWIIKGILPRADLAVVFGESGSGKSFWVFDLVCHIARGIPYRGKKVKQHHVAYIAAEGAGGFKNRVRAYAKANDIDLTDLDISVIADAPDFMKTNDVREVCDAILALPVAPSLIIVDTLSAVTPGANENSGEDMGKALGHCRVLRAATGAMILLIHHSGKDATKGARGWSGLRAAADAEFEITRFNDERAATISKLKDGGADGGEFGFKLVSVHLGEDEDGDPITSCVVEHGQAAHRPRVVLGNIERLSLGAFEEMATLSGDDIAVGALIEVVVAELPQDPQKRDQRRLRVQRALDGLVSKNVLISANGILSRATT